MRASSTTTRSIEDYTSSEKYTRILTEAIYPHHFLTWWQVLHLFGYKAGSKTKVQGMLGELANQEIKLLHSFYLPLNAKNRPYVYGLGEQGKKYLVRNSFDVRIYYHPSEKEALTYDKMMHNLELNDILISARLLEKSEPRLYLFDWVHDLVLERQPLQLIDKTGKRHEVVPDGVLDFRMPRAGKKDARVFLCLEHDRGTASNDKIRRKIRDYLSLREQGVLEKRYGAQQFTVIFTTSAGARRVEKLQMLARLELGGGVPEGSSTNQMFKFVAVPPLMERSPLDPRTLFCEGELWLSPYGDKEKPGRLIDLGKLLP